MHQSSTKISSFIGKSLLWSILLYSCAVVILDWSDIKSTFSSTESRDIVYSTTSEKPDTHNISADTIGKHIFKLPKSILLNAINKVVGDMINGSKN